MSFYHNRQERRKQFFSTVAKNYLPAKRADNPDIIFSILALASNNISSAMSGTHAQHEFVEIFHPYLYPENIVYHYINKDSAGTRQIECAFPKSEFSADEWASISGTASNRRARIKSAVLSRGVLH
jgi:hypothetical protein